jgi:1,4-dihydroxy-2-naphthoate octaprenyltransferase
MPVFLAGAIAYSEDIFKPLYFIIALLAAAAVQIGLTMLNDTLDFAYGTDRKKIGAKNPFSGSSGVLTSGIITLKQAIGPIFFLCLFALIGAIYLTLEVGIGILWIAIIGAVISIFYSAKPFRFAYHGLGELMMFLGYGLVLTTWGYFVHSTELKYEILLIGAIPGFLMWTMILINEIPDYEEDRAAGKKNIVYRIGPKNTKNLFIASLAGLYIYIAALLIWGILPPAGILAFLGVPLALKAAAVASRYYLDPLKVIPANRFMVFIYSLTMVAITIGFLI